MPFDPNYQYNPLLDNDFLKKLFKDQKRVIYVKITSLTLDEYPVESIEGRITQGNINLDGKSSMRRSCSMTVATSLDTNLEDSLNWSLNTKIKIEVGLENNIDTINYDSIVWFNLGIFILSSFTYSKTSTNYSIQLQGKDKMCLLNGDISGEIYASVDFGSEDLINKNTGARERVEIPVEDIIREGVREQAREPYHNIIIKDLPKYGLNLLEWANSNELYVLIDTASWDSAEANNATLNRQVFLYDGSQQNTCNLKDLPNSFVYFDLNSGFTNIDPNAYSEVFLHVGGTYHPYWVAKIETGQTVGFEPDYLIYPHGEDDSGLTISPGGTFTEILDKIVTFLGDYEYFYNTEGQFVFQKKQEELNFNWKGVGATTVGMGNIYSITSEEPIVWNFNEEELITTFSDSPNISNIRNDYSIWGTLSKGDNEVPIHLRYAIDHKPVWYTSIYMEAEEITEQVRMHPEFKNSFPQDDNGDYLPISSITYKTDKAPSNWQSDATTYVVDWREVIYQMARDYLKFKHFDQFLARVAEVNAIDTENHLYPFGITGYEQYYVDLEAEWRNLYHPADYVDFNDRIKYDPVLRTDEDFDLNSEKQVKDLWYNYSTWVSQTNKDRINFDEYFALSMDRKYILLKDPENLDVKAYLGFLTYYPNATPTSAVVQTLFDHGVNRSSQHLGDYNGSSNDYYEPLYYLYENTTNKAGGIDFSYDNRNGGTSTNHLGTGLYIDNKSYEDEDAINVTDIGQLQDISTRIGDVITSPCCGFQTERYNLLVPIDPNIYTNYDTLLGKELIESRNWNDSADFYTIYQFKRYETVPSYNADKTQRIGDKTIHNNHYYSCKENILTPEPWNSNHWTQIAQSDLSYSMEYYMYDSGVHYERVDDPYLYYTSTYPNDYTTVGDYNKFIFKRKLVRINDPAASTQGIRYYSSEENTVDGRVDWVYRAGFTETYASDSSTYLTLGEVNESRNTKNFVIKSRISPLSKFENSNGEFYLFRADLVGSNDTRIQRIKFTNTYLVNNNREDIQINTLGRRLYNNFNRPKTPTSDEFVNYYYDTSTFNNNFFYLCNIENNNYQNFNTISNFPFFFQYGGSISKQNLLPSYQKVQVNSVTYSPETFKGGNSHNVISYNINSNDTITYYQEGLRYSTFEGTAGLWNPLITSNPEQLTFWFDFSESEYSSQIGKYGANKIQQRSKVTSDEHITALYYGDTLNIAWEYSGEDEEKYNQLNPYLHEAEYPIFNIPDFFKSSFKSSSKAKSCKDVLISWLQNYTYANESLNFSALPIYTLQPNELIQINNSIYRVNSISIPLSYNGTMSVQAVKEVDLFYKEEETWFTGQSSQVINTGITPFNEENMGHSWGMKISISLDDATTNPRLATPIINNFLVSCNVVNPLLQYNPSEGTRVYYWTGGASDTNLTHNQLRVQDPGFGIGPDTFTGGDNNMITCVRGTNLRKREGAIHPLFKTLNDDNCKENIVKITFDYEHGLFTYEITYVYTDNSTSSMTNSYDISGVTFSTSNEPILIGGCYTSSHTLGDYMCVLGSTSYPVKFNYYNFEQIEIES